MTTVSAVPTDQVLARIAPSLRLPATYSDLTVPLVAQALRRAVSILSPCARHELQHAVEKSFTGIIDDAQQLRALVEETTEALLVYGDILEMRPLESDDWQTASIVLRPSPPSFIQRSDKSIAVIGVAGDDITPLAGEIETRLEYRQALRILKPQPDEDLAAALIELGLLELTEAVWLRLPPVETVETYIARWDEHLRNSPTAQIESSSLRVLSQTDSFAYYPSRWVEPLPTQGGMHLARRPQKYGSDLWCLVDLDHGNVSHLMDIYSAGDRLRPCDVAWRIQMAIDARNGRPQRFRARRTSDACFIDFFSPIPSWAERRLSINGQRAQPYRCLITYEIPAEAFEFEAQFLRERLWLKLIEEDAEGGAA